MGIKKIWDIIQTCLWWTVGKPLAIIFAFYCIPALFLFLVGFFIKEKVLYTNSYRILCYKDQNQEAKKWLFENIKYPYAIIEEVRVSYNQHGHCEDHVIGWDYRFIRKTDYIAFKIMWAEENES